MQLRKTQLVDWITLIIIVLLTALYAWTMMEVPFHPDESTQIYMSKDITSLFQNPLELTWGGSTPLPDEDRIRAIDAPLAKFLIGAVREIFSIPPLEADWNWGASWEENLNAGALPSQSQLLISRSIMTALLPFSLWFFYLALKKVLPPSASLAATLLMGMNPLLLLHGRRAMSESVLIFGVGFFLWGITRDKRNPWLIGLAVAISINAKHSALGLLPAALLAVILLPGEAPNPRRAGLNILKTALVLSTITILLNPFYWKDPLGALRTGAQARFKLAGEQKENHLERLGVEGSALKITIPGLLLNTYFSQPQTEEVGNYLAYTEETRSTYLANPIHTWGRDPISGAILAALTFAGMGFILRGFSQRTPRERNIFLLILLTTVGLGAFLATLLPWQRYVLAVLPLTFFWIGAGLTPIFTFKKKAG